jgi:hypothetical protein
VDGGVLERQVGLVGVSDFPLFEVGLVGWFLFDEELRLAAPR